MKNVEDLYPLSPMQNLMLLHSETTRSSDVLLNQLLFVIEGELDIAAFRNAWQQLVDRHPILRTCFVWEGLREPLQAVRQSAVLPFELLDWQEVPASRRETELEALCVEDRKRGFDLTKAPLMRVTLIRYRAEEFRVLWNSHHLLLDRWCLSLALEQLGRFYRASSEGRPLPREPVRPFRDYIRWIQRQDPGEARRFWRESLRDVTRSTPLAIRDFGRFETVCSVELSEPATERARQFARRERVTMSTLLQGGLALIISRLHGSSDALFGATVSGRPPEIPGVESILGSFVNNVPVRVHLGGEVTVGDWLREIHRHQNRRAPFEYVSLGDIHKWSELGAGQQLFDTLLVWLSPVSTSAEELPMRGLARGLRTGYPVTLTVAEDEGSLRMELRCAPGYDTKDGLEGTLGLLQTTIDRLVKAGDHPLSEAHRDLPERDPKPALPRSCTMSGAASPLSRVDLRHSRTPHEDLLLESFQTLLLHECREVLGHESLGASDNFFEMGGNSLHAAWLQRRIESLTGRSVPLLALFREPTVDGMTAALKVSPPASTDAVREIRATGSRPPLFCVASPEVSTLGYALLAMHLDAEQPVYVLQSQEGEVEPTFLNPSAVPDLADRYLQAMETVRFDGPVRFIGMCGGAHVAVEMARKLGARGIPVDFVGVINTWGFGTLSWKIHLWHLRNRYLYYRKRIDALTTLDIREQIRSIASVLKQRLPRSASNGNGHLSRSDFGNATRDRAARRSWRDDYEPRNVPLPPRYDGTVIVFRLDRQPFFRLNDETLGWKAIAEHVVLERLSANDHLDILREPEVRELALKVEARLQRRDAIAMSVGPA